MASLLQVFNRCSQPPSAPSLLIRETERNQQVERTGELISKQVRDQPPDQSDSIHYQEAFTELPYLLFAIGMFMNFWGLYVGFFYIGSFSRNR
jgi:hypothetical protein